MPGRPASTTFTKQLGDWITHTLAQRYNGKTAPRLVLFSPIAHEDLGNPDLPDGRENNERLALYTRAMEGVAKAHGVTFVDLFTPTRQLYDATAAPLTLQGDSPQYRREPSGRPDHRSRAVRRPAEARGALPGAAAAGGRGQERLLVPPLPRHRRLFHLRRPGVPDVRPRQSAQRQREGPGQGQQGGRPPDQLRGPAARAPDPRRDDRQPRPADLGGGARRRGQGRSPDRRLRHPAVRRRQDQPGEGAALPERGGIDREDDHRPGAEGRAVRLGEGVPRADQPGPDGVRHPRPAVGGVVEELPALAAEDADGRQAAHPRGHQRRRQGRQADGVRRRSDEPDRLRVLERRRHRRRSSRTWCS